MGAGIGLLLLLSWLLSPHLPLGSLASSHGASHSGGSHSGGHGSHSLRLKPAPQTVEKLAKMHHKGYHSGYHKVTRFPYINASEVNRFKAQTKKKCATLERLLNRENAMQLILRQHQAKVNHSFALSDVERQVALACIRLRHQGTRA